MENDAGIQWKVDCETQLGPSTSIIDGKKMIPKEKRNYVDCWDEDKIKQVLEERLEELKNKNDKSKSRIKLLRAKITKLRRALEGKGIAGGQVAPSNNSGGVKSGKRDKKGTKKDVKFDNSEDTTGDQNTDGPLDNYNLDSNSSCNPDTRSVTRTTSSKSIDKTRKKIKKICFGCRKRGHLLKDCRENRSEAVCFRCGSKEHTLKNCKFKSNSTVAMTEDFTSDKERLGAAEEKKVELPYASCFVCGQVGHLSSQCPQNPKGMYPKGSGCYFCGSVRHKRIHCPLAKGKTGGSGSNSIPIGVRRSNNIHKEEE